MLEKLIRRVGALELLFAHHIEGDGVAPRRIRKGDVAEQENGTYRNDWKACRRLRIQTIHRLKGGRTCSEAVDNPQLRS